MIVPIGARIGLTPCVDLKDECYACILANDPVELRIGNRIQKLVITAIDCEYGIGGMVGLTIEIKSVGESKGQKQ